MTKEEMTKEEIIKNLEDVKDNIGKFNKSADRLLNLLENLKKSNYELKKKFKIME